MIKVNPLILLLLVSISLNGLFGYLSYKFYSEKGAVQTALISCQESNISLEKSIEKQSKEKDITDIVVSENQQKQQEIHREQCQIIEQITLLDSKKGQQSNEIDIDSKLPDSLSGLLTQAYNSLQRSSGSDASKPSN